MKPPRFTLRRVMLLVALIALRLVFYRRQVAFAERAKHHAHNEWRAPVDAKEAMAVAGWRQRGAESLEFAAYHGPLKLKYERAARLPFLPDSADPPEPE